MSLRGRLKRGAIWAGLLLACALGTTAGIRLGHAASEPHVEEIEVTAPRSLAGPPEGTIRSLGGFTGFGGPPAIRGEVQRSGSVLRAETGSVTVGTGESQSTVRYNSPERLFRIVPASAAPRAGDLVQVRLEGDRATSVLRLPPGLEEGGNRPR